MAAVQEQREHLIMMLADGDPQTYKNTRVHVF